MWQYSSADWQRKCSRQCNEPNGQNTGPCTQEQVLECHFQKWTRYIHCAWRLDWHENKKVVEVSRILLRRILPSCQCRSNGGINWRSPSSTPAPPSCPELLGCKASRLASSDSEHVAVTQEAKFRFRDKIASVVAPGIRYKKKSYVIFSSLIGICTGPKREFFACFCKDIIDPKRGLFVAADDSQYRWL